MVLKAPDDNQFLALASAARQLGAVRVKHGPYEMAWEGPPLPDGPADRGLTSPKQAELERLRAFAENAKELGLEVPE